MRHVIGLLFGIVLAPVIWFLAALGHFRFLDATVRFEDAPDRLPAELAFGALLILAAGAWLGVLLSSRLSPLAPGVLGLIWLGLGATYIAKTEKLTDLLPGGPNGQDDLFVLPLEHGYVYLIGAAMLSPLFSPARWRGAPKRAEAVEIIDEDEPVEEPEPTPPPTRERYGPPRAVALPDERRSATGSYPVVRPERPAAVPDQQPRMPRLSSWNEDSSTEDLARRNGTG